MGEQPDTVFNVGALGVENVLNAPLMALSELAADLNFDIREGHYAVVTFHPVTMDNDNGVGQIDALLSAMNEFSEMQFIITKSNSDAGGRKINQIWNDYSAEHKNCLMTASLGMKRYLSVLKYASFMLGNSSSGITEGSVMHIPVVNIGDRQRGRIMGEGIICCEAEKNSIIDAMKSALNPQFKESVRQAMTPYGDGHTSEKIVEIIRNRLYNKKLSTKKQFYDVEFVC
jgi:GDP/UDP-N,N'-diacetylbacillosamine 2-epimerase (hydrolysing)